MISENTKFKWTEVDQKAFEEMKLFVGKYSPLAYTNFSNEFVIHTATSKTQLGAVISQVKRPITFYSCKLMTSQT